MSIKIMSAVWDADLHDTELLLLVALADFADDDGAHVFPSRSRIAWKIGASERTVQRLMGTLREKGYIEMIREPSRHSPPEYRIHVNRLPPKAPFVARGDKLAPLKNRGETPEVLGETPDASRGDTGGMLGETELCLPTRHLSVKTLEPPIEPSQAPLPPEGASVPAGFSTKAFEGFWSTCPKKVGKLAAEAAYRRAIKLATAEELQEAITRAAAGWRATEDRYIPHPSTWLNQGRWFDEQRQQERQRTDPNGSAQFTGFEQRVRARAAASRQGNPDAGADAGGPEKATG